MMPNKAESYSEMKFRQRAFLVSMGKDINLYHERKNNAQAWNSTNETFSKKEISTVFIRFSILLAVVLFLEPLLG